MKKKLWPDFQSDYYFTIVVESNVTEEKVNKIVNEMSGITSASLMDTQKVQQKLRRRLLDKKIYLNSEAIIRNKTYLKVFLNRDQDPAIMPLVKKRFLDRFSSYRIEASPIKTLRKSLANNSTLNFLRQWSDFIIKALCSLIWLLSALFYSYRTKVFLMLCENFKFEAHLRTKIFSSQIVFCLILTILLKFLLAATPSLGSLLASAFLLLGICGLYYLGTSRTKLPW